MTVLGITGGSGRVGRHAIDAALRWLSPKQIVVTSRTPEVLAGYAERGVVVRFADFDRPENLADAFRNVDRLLMISATNATGRRNGQHTSAVEAAKAAGVERIAFTSMPGVDRPGHPSGLAAQEYRAAELAILASGLDHVVLRVAPYAELNAVERMITAVREGALRINTGEGRAAFIARADVAEAAVAAVLSAESRTGIVDITGAELRSFAEVADAVSSVVGRQIRYEAISDEEYCADLLSAGDSPLLAEAVSGLGKAIRCGYFEVRTRDAQNLLNRRPRSLEDVVNANKRALRVGLGR